MTKRRPLALGAAAAIGFGSLFIASPAIAEEITESPITTETSEVQNAPEENITSPEDSNAPAEDSNAPAEDAPETEDSTVPDEISDDNAEELDKAGVVAFGTNEDGNPVVVIEATDAATIAEAEANPSAFTEVKEILGTDVAPEIVPVKATPKPFAEGDVVAGSGYASPGQFISGGETVNGLFACSIGFNAFTAEGDPAILSAGHCGYDALGNAMTANFLTIPGEEPAVGGEGYEFTDPPVQFGAFSFAQFGGPNGTTGSNGDVNSTDVSVIDVAPNGWNLLPEVTNWTTAGAALDSLSNGTIPVKTVGSPATGAVSKSGRTTGFTNGNVSANDILDGWSMIEDRWVRGFSSNVQAGPGDSGGSVLQGTTAVGLISGGLTPEQNNGVQWTWSTSLVHALAFTDVEVALDIDEPTVTPAAGSQVPAGSEISVTVPSNATELVVGFGQAGDVRPVTGGETVIVNAPNEIGEFTYSFTATNGQSSSATVEYTAEVVLAGPVIHPVDTDSTTFTLSGLGVVGAEINGTAGDLPFTAVVEADGSWSTELELEIGAYVATATQTVDGEESDASSADLLIRPVAPVITSIAEGSSFAAAKAPSSISGTGSEGATIVVAWGDQAVETTVVDGAWTVDFGAPLAAGDYALAATQNVNAVSSYVTAVNFSVLADATVPPANPGNGDLANTGGAPLMPLGIAAFAMLLVGGAVTIAMARRKKATEI